MSTPIAWQVPGELLCEECAHGRWGDAVYEPDFDAPEYPGETSVLHSWEVESGDCCTECHENLFEQAGYYVPGFGDSDDEEE